MPSTSASGTTNAATEPNTYRLQTLWPKITLLEFSSPDHHKVNSSEMFIEITGGLLHSKSAPLVAPLYIAETKAGQTGILNEKPQRSTLWKQLLSRGVAATIVASGNERLVFDTTYLGRIPKEPHPRRPSTHTDWKEEPPVIDGDPIEEVAVFQFCSRLEFPPTSLDFYVVGTTADPEELRSKTISKLGDRSTSSIQLRQQVDEISSDLKMHHKDINEMKDQEHPLQATVKRWPSRDTNIPVWMFWWQRQSQQFLVGMILRRFHR